MDNDYSAYEADAAPVDADNILAQITMTARELRDAQGVVASCEASLREAQEKVRLLAEKTLPELMDEAKQEKLRTSDGYDLEVKEVLRASVPVGGMPAAAAWLRERSLDAIIKREVKVTFSRGEDQKAAMVVEQLLSNDIIPEDKASINVQTLAATIREQLKAGVEVPFEVFGVHIQRNIAMKEVKR